MERVIYDGLVDQKDTTLYTFITESLEDAKDLFYEYYNEDLEEYVDFQGLCEFGDVKGITVYLEMQKETNIIEQASIGIQFKTEEDELEEIECQEIEIDEDTLELLLSKVDG